MKPGSRPKLTAMRAAAIVVAALVTVSCGGGRRDGIHGRVTDARGKGVVGAAVTATREGCVEVPAKRIVAVTASDGGYRFEGLEDGNYALEAAAGRELMMAPRGVEFVRARGVATGRNDVEMKFPA